jgi:hypothetical protein
MPTHKEEIMRRLHRGETLTRRDALLEFGCGRLAARINELRDAGEPIETEMIDVTNADGSTSRVAEYRLAGDEQEEKPQRFGALPLRARFELEGHQWRKTSAFQAVCSDTPRKGFRDVEPQTPVQLLNNPTS